MAVRVRFFARFRELLGTDRTEKYEDGKSIADCVRKIARKNHEGFDAIFDTKGNFHPFVIIMLNGKRIDILAADTILVSDGDEIAVFPPVAGG